MNYKLIRERGKSCLNEIVTRKINMQYNDNDIRFAMGVSI